MKNLKDKQRGKGFDIRSNPWTCEEEEMIHDLALLNGHAKWSPIAKSLNRIFHQGIKVRSPRQVREHWLNYLDPSLSKQEWTSEEDRLLHYYHAVYGKSWASIAKVFPSRNENQIKNRLKTLKRLNRQDLIISDRQITSNLASHSSTSKNAPEDALTTLGDTSPLILDDWDLADFDWETVDIDEFINLEGFN